MYKENDNPNRKAIEKYMKLSDEELDTMIAEREKAIKEETK